MLILSRKLGESIKIGEINVRVTRIDNERVKLGIDAPKNCPIIRGELVSQWEANAGNQNDESGGDEP